MMQTKLYQQIASLLVIPYITIAQITPNPTKSPTNSPTNSPILTSITGCPPLWSADNTPAPPPGSEKYQRGSIVSNPFAGSGTIRNVYQCSTIESYYLFCPLSAFEPGNPTYQWEIAWTLLGSCDSSTPYISPTTSPTSAAPTFAVWSGTGCPREFDSSLLTPYELGDVVTYDTNDGQGSLVYECISNVIGRCYQGGYTPGEPFVNEAWSVLGTCTGTLTPTTSPTETILAPWTLGGCPESFVSQTMYKEGDVVEDNGKVYECKLFPYSGLCGQAGYKPGSENGEVAWISRGSCTGTLQPSPAPTTVPLPVWDKVGCPEEYDDDPESVTSYGEGDFVSLDGVVYKCTNIRCNQDGYEPDSDLGEETWDIEGSCTGTIAPSAGPNLPAWSLGPGCPQEFQWGEDANGVVTVGIPSAYEADTYVHVNERVYQCKDGVNAGFCKIHAPDGTFGYLGWIDLERSCDSSQTTVPQPEEEGGGGGGGAITAFDTKAGYTDYGPGCPPLFEVCVTANGCGAGGIQKDDLVSNPCSTDSSLNCAYECKSNCGRAGYEPGNDYLHYGALWIQDFTELGSCTSAPFSPPPASDVPQADVLLPWEFGGCPDAWDDTITYSGGDYVSSSSTVYKCKNGPNEQFCNLIPPEGLNGHSGSLGWETIGSCTGTLDPLPAPTCGDIPTYTEDFLTNANWESEPQQVVNVDGTIYRCQTFFAATAWCSNSQYDPTGMAGYLAWDTCTSCASYEATGSLGSNCPDVAS